MSMSRNVLLVFILMLIVVPLSAQERILERITPENADRLQEIERIGNGIFTGGISYSPDGNTLAVAGSIGVWFYNANDLNLAPTLLDLDQWVDEVGYSPDGRYFAYHLRDRLDVVVIETVSGAEVLRVDDADTFAFHPDGERVAIAIRVDPSGQGIYSTHPEIPIYDLASGQIVQTYDFRFWTKSRGYTKDMAFSPDGELLAVSVADFAFDTCDNGNRSVYLWRMDEDADQIPVSVQYAERMQFLPDSSAILSAQTGLFPGGVLGAVFLWNIESQETIRSFSVDENDYTNDFTLSADGRTVFTNGWSEIQVWDGETGALRNTIDTVIGDIRQIIPVPDGNGLITVHPTRLQLWNLTNGGMRQIALAQSLSETEVVIHQSGAMIMQGYQDESLRLWVFDENGILTERSLTMPERQWWFEAVSANGQMVLFLDGEQLSVWDIAVGEDRVINVDYSPDDLWRLSADGSLLLQETVDGRLQTWSTATGALISTLAGEFNGYIHINISPDSSLVAVKHVVSIVEMVTTIHLGVWDVASGQMVWDFGTYEVFTDITEGAAWMLFSTDSTRIAIYNQPNLTDDEFSQTVEENVVVYDLASREVVFDYDSYGGLSPNFDYLRVYLRPDAPTSQSLRWQLMDTLTNEITVNGRGGFLDFSPDETRFVSGWNSVTSCGGDERILSLYDTSVPLPLVEIQLPSRQAGIPDVVDFNSDGLLLVVGGENHLRLYDAQTGELLHTIEDSPDREALFNPTDTLLVTTGSDGTIRLYGVVAE